MHTTILCMLPKCSHRPVQCIPSIYLEKNMDLLREVIPVIWQDQATTTTMTKNGTTWTCTTTSSDRCDIPVQTPLEETPECICLRPCTLLLCSCGSHGYRLFEGFSNPWKRECLLWVIGTLLPKAGCALYQ